MSPGPPVLPASELARATAALAAGGVVVVPTDTVYGLAADPSRPGAGARLFAIKGRPSGVPIAVLVADVAQAEALAAVVPPPAAALMARYWPGALTLVLPRRLDVRLDLGDAGATVGVRCPDHPVPRALAAELGPLATTSANRHGEPPLPTAAAAAAALGDDVALVLDGGTCAGAASTVVDCTGPTPRVLREGALPGHEVLAAAR